MVTNAVLRTILLVDDNLPTLELYQRELGRAYRVLTCTDEVQAIEALRREVICAVVLEPFAVGEAGCARLAAVVLVPSARPVPVLICSTQDRTIGLAMNEDAWLIKPVLPPALLAAIRRIDRPA